MPLADPFAGPAAPASALQLAWCRQRRRLGRTALFMCLLCLSIALLLNAFDVRGLGSKMVYSFAIGGCCWGINDATRLGLAWLSDRLRPRFAALAEPDSARNRWLVVGLATLVCVLAGPPLGMAIGDAVTGNHSPALWPMNTSNSRVTVVITLLATVVTVTVLSSMERLAHARAEAEAALRQASQSQLRLLQSQLEPHMLFNTLANLRVLIALDPARAQAMLDRLISFLRATLQASQQGEHPLATEFDRVADYLALMAVRMGPRLQVQLDLPAELSAWPVPPLLLQPLVENGIQHGLEPKVQGGRIEVRARREAGPDRGQGMRNSNSNSNSNDVLVITVRDTGIGRSAAATASSLGATPAKSVGGFGLTGARERLATLYGTRASLELADAPDSDGGTLVTVRLPMDTGRAA